MGKRKENAIPCRMHGAAATTTTMVEHTPVFIVRGTPL